MHHALQTGVQHGTVQVIQAQAPLAELKNLEQILPAQERPAGPCDGCSNVMHNASQISALHAPFRMLSLLPPLWESMCWLHAPFREHHCPQRSHAGG